MDRVCNQCGRKIEAYEWAREDLMLVSMGYGPDDLIPTGHTCVDCAAVEELASGTASIRCADCGSPAPTSAAWEAYYGGPLDRLLLSGWAYEALEDWQDWPDNGTPPVLHYCPTCARYHDMANIYRPEEDA